MPSVQVGAADPALGRDQTPVTESNFCSRVHKSGGRLGSGGSTLRWWSQSGGFTAEQKWICSPPRSQHTVRCGTPSLIQPLWAWVLWCRPVHLSPSSSAPTSPGQSAPQWGPPPYSGSLLARSSLVHGPCLPPKRRLPSWDLSVVLDGLLEAPFEPMESASEKFLTLKMALLLALASLRWVGDLQALLVAPACLEFAPGMSKAILHLRARYVPKVPRMAGHPVILQAFCLPPNESAEQERLHLLCPNKGNLVSKQRLAHWVVEAITQAYEARGITSPLGVRAHSTRGVTSSSALARGVPLQEICDAADWSSLHTFIRFYNLDLDPTPGSQVLQG
ncbi:hypothetical protein QTP86_008616 [Hemibagrus guttatus]|nr:hypothetical protein QTP86_008616 [Hemibagrus guttatus]